MTKVVQIILGLKGGLIGCVARLVRCRKPVEYSERIFLEDGTLIHEEAPYKFARLFRDGQKFIMYGKCMIVKSCKLNGTYVDTVVSIPSNNEHRRCLSNQTENLNKD